MSNMKKPGQYGGLDFTHVPNVCFKFNLLSIDSPGDCVTVLYCNTLRGHELSEYNSVNFWALVYFVFCCFKGVTHRVVKIFSSRCLQGDKWGLCLLLSTSKTHPHKPKNDQKPCKSLSGHNSTIIWFTSFKFWLAALDFLYHFPQVAGGTDPLVTVAMPPLSLFDNSMFCSGQQILVKSAIFSSVMIALLPSPMVIRLSY